MSFYNYEKTRAIEVKNGIKTKHKKLQSWISERWVEFIKGFMIGARFDRGRSYAKKGQVLDIAIEPGVVKARVQGSKRSPYSIEITFKTLDYAAWCNIAEILRNDTVLCAKVLSAGETGSDLPRELEEFFAREGGSLFPTLENDSSMNCSCPDWSIPCKHLVAVFILLGEAFEADPFLIFKLRGIERNQLLELLGINRGINKPDCEAEKESLAYGESFYRCGELPVFSLHSKPDKNAELIHELGNLPLWKGAHSLEELLEQTYIKASDFAAQVLNNYERNVDINDNARDVGKP